MAWRKTTSFPFAFHRAPSSTTTFHWRIGRRCKIDTLIGKPVSAVHGFQDRSIYIGRKDDS